MENIKFKCVFDTYVRAFQLFLWIYIYYNSYWNCADTNSFINIEHPCRYVYWILRIDDS